MCNGRRNLSKKSQILVSKGLCRKTRFFLVLCSLFVCLTLSFTSNAYAGFSEDIERLSNPENSIDERFIESVRSQVKSWPLSIEFTKSAGSNAKLISGVYLMIIDQDDLVVFDEIIGAPFFVADFDPGNYRLVSANRGVRKDLAISLEPGINLHVVLNWI